MIEMIPQEFFDAVPVPPAVTLDGELLAVLHRATSSYRPTADQVDQVRATYVFSVGPGSTILAVRCDTDHAIPHPIGPTVIGNLLPFDRPWHIGKTRGELSVTVDHNGRVTMTTVSGQTRTVTPYDHRMTAADDNPPSHQ